MGHRTDMSWLSGYRRPSPHYERNPRNYLCLTTRPPHHIGHGLRGPAQLPYFATGARFFERSGRLNDDPNDGGKNYKDG